ncbi:unnamed protein product [Cuscuta epithymum]|uniref:Peptidase A1 domain-containing protein n=1 Tax=Cuscuta epithymum TaxID=186058 RepID=A0AAV0G460_9ASTE|nr:unnamed protein product [Cuscuta epithymum]
MLPSLLVLLCFLLVLTTSYDAAAVVHNSYGDKQVLSLQKLQWRKQLYNNQLNPSRSPAQKSRKENGAIVLEMRHTDHFFMSSGSLIKNWDQWQQQLIRDDEIRVGSIQSWVKSAEDSAQSFTQTQPITSGLKLQTLNYIVTITIGTTNMTVIVDTGSDLTWVQCQPCTSCYTQPQPLYNPESSPSYLSVPCNATACHNLSTGNSGLCRGSSSVCNYTVSYGDGSYTNGELGRDRLVLGSTSIDGFVFGCGKNNKGLFGSASGLMGLGRSDLSLISQTSDVFGRVFSYCLPSSTDSENSKGSLVFGGDSLLFKNSTPISYAAMVQNPQLYSFYILNHTRTSIGGVLVQDSNRSHMMILDSGTVITRLPPSIYKAFKAEFLKQFSGYTIVTGYSILDTCFDFSAYEEVNIPTVTLQFEGGAELSVDITGIFYFAKSDASQVCLAMASLTYEDDIGIIGNYQQRNTRVVYDTNNSRVGFAKEVCSFV